jgi:hypothetical protein
MRGAQSLLDNPGEGHMALLPDDVWHRAGDLLLDAHAAVEDPLDYMLMDYAKRVKFLQKADSKRIDLLLVSGSIEAAERLVHRDAAAVIELGRNLLEELEKIGVDTSEYGTLAEAPEQAA